MGDFSFNIVGSSGTAWNVYASTNLSNWTQIGTNLTLPTNIDSLNGDTNFTDTTVTNVPYRFYQLSNDGCASVIIGFANLSIGPGTNLIADQFWQTDDNVMSNSAIVTPMNSVNDLFGYYWSPNQNGNDVMVWNGQSFDIVSFFKSHSEIFWFDTDGNSVAGDDLVLPGSSVLISNANSAFTNTFYGLVREQHVVQVPPGTNYLSSTVPVAGAITNITGYVPHNGDVVQLWNTISNLLQAYTNDGITWLPSNPPPVSVGEGFVLITTNAYTWTNTWPH